MSAPFPPRSSRQFAKRYTHIRDLGSGAFGSVELHKDLRSGESVAIKRIHPKYASTFADDEAVMTALVARSPKCHPNLACLVDSFSVDSVPVIVSTFIDGTSLDQLVTALRKHREVTTPELVTKIGIDISKGLAYLHKKTIAHVDVKPDNIMVEGIGVSGGSLVIFPGARAVLVDLGIACVTPSAPHFPKCAHAGTAVYMSPELLQYRKAKKNASAPLYFANDVYSLGLTLWELATRRVKGVINEYTRLNNGAKPSSLSTLYLLGHRLVPARSFFVRDRRVETIIKAMVVQHHEDRPTARSIQRFFANPALTPPTLDHTKPLWVSPPPDDSGPIGAYVTYASY
jgi:serine/threonine protein kinase